MEVTGTSLRLVHGTTPAVLLITALTDIRTFAGRRSDDPASGCASDLDQAAVVGWATLLACSYPVLEVLFSIHRKIKRQGHHPGQPDRCHLHHFLHRRVVRKLFPGVSRTLQNGLTGSLVWFLAAMPAAWAVVFYQSTTALVIGFFLASFGYMALFARLTQFVWCFQAATMRRTEILADRPG